MHEPHLRERDMLLHDEKGNEHFGIPIKFSCEPGQVKFDLPRLGQHNEKLLRELGYSATAIAALTEQKIILGDV